MQLITAGQYLNLICKDFRPWIKGYKLEKIYVEEEGNFNLFVMNNGKRKINLSVPKEGTTCKTSFFGDTEYMERYLKGSHSWQAEPVKYTQINFN